MTGLGDRAPTSTHGDAADQRSGIDPLIGVMLGDYRIKDVIGRGGQGTVYRAIDERLNRRVAIKVMTHAPFMPQDVRTRFIREAEFASRLEHPGICPVFAVGEAQGMPWIAMPYLEGATLQDLLRQRREAGIRPFDPSSRSRSGGNSSESGESESTTKKRDVVTTVRLVESIARALHYAHEHGLVHRDVKPGNVMVLKNDRTILLDFGLAHDDRIVGPELTQSGDCLGTPAYMSPEQVSGRRLVDRRTDVHALGIVLFECLTLQRPFEAPTREELYRQVVEIPARDVRRLNAAVPKDLAVVVACALEKDPDRRYASAEAMADDLARVADRRPILARPVPPWMHALRWAERNPIVAALSILLIASLSVGLIANAQKNAALSREKEAALWSAYCARVAAAHAALERGDVAAVKANLDQAPPIHRGWEWRWIDRACDQSVSTIPISVGDAPVLVAASASEMAVYLADGRGRIRKIDPHSGSILDTIDIDRGIQQIAVAPDGRFLLVRTIDSGGSATRGEILLWDVQARLVLWRLPFDSSLGPRPFSADAAQIVIGAGDGLHIHETLTGKRIRNVHEGYARLATYTDDGDILAVVFTGDKSDVEVYASDSSESPARPLRRATLDVKHRHWAFDGSRFWFGATAGNNESGRQGVVLDSRSGETRSVAMPKEEFTLAGAGVIAARRGSTIDLWDTVIDKPFASLRGHAGVLTALVVVNHGRDLVSVANDGTMRVWPVEPELRDWSSAAETAPGCSLSTDGSRSVMTEWGGVRFVDTRTCKILWRTVYSRRFIVASAISHADRHIAVADDVGNVTILNAEDGSILRSVAPMKRVAIGDVLWSPDDRFLWIPLVEGGIDRIEMTTGSRTAVGDLGAPPSAALVVSSDGDLLVATGKSTKSDPSLWRVDSDSGETQRLCEVDRPITALAVDRLGRSFLAGDDSGRVMERSSADGAVLRTLASTSIQVQSLARFDSIDRIAVGSNIGVELLDAVTGRSVARLGDAQVGKARYDATTGTLVTAPARFNGHFHCYSIGTQPGEDLHVNLRALRWTVSLLAKLHLTDDIRAALASTAWRADPRIVAEANRVAPLLCDNFNVLNSIAWGIVLYFSDPAKDDLDTAQRCADRSFDLCPDEWEIINTRSLALVRSKRYRDALDSIETGFRHYSRSTKRTNLHASDLAMRAICRFHLGDRRLAQEDVLEAEKSLVPGDGDSSALIKEARTLLR